MTSSSTAGSAFATVPVDIIPLIASHILSENLGAFRLVCHAFSTHSLSSFGRSCLQELTTDLSFASLNRLTQVAQAPHLAHFPKVLLIKAPRIRSGNDERSLREGCIWIRDNSGAITSPNPGLVTLQKVLLGDNGGGLVNCHDFCVSSDIFNEAASGRDLLMPTDAVNIVLNMFAAGVCVRSFRLAFRDHGSGELNNQHIDWSICQREEFMRIWSALEDLSLEASLTEETFAPLLALTNSAKNVKKLGLRLECDYAAEFLRKLSDNDVTQNLEHLSLESFRFNAALLLGTTRSSASSLKKLELKSMVLRGAVGWHDIFQEFKVSLINLKTFHASFLFWRSSGNHRITFSGLRHHQGEDPSFDLRLQFMNWRGLERAFGVSYHGHQMEAALDLLIATMETI